MKQLLISVILAIILYSCGENQPPEPSGEPSYYIYYTKYYKENDKDKFGIFRNDISGKNEVKILDSAYLCSSPALGLMVVGRIEELGIKHIYIADAKTGNLLKELFNDTQYSRIGDVVLSPDGSIIAFFGDDDTETSASYLFLINPDGSGLRPAFNYIVYDNAIRFSRNGKSLVFATTDEYIYNYDLSANSMIIIGEPPDGFTFESANFAWLPDGSKIVYTAESNSGDRKILIVADSEGWGWNMVTLDGVSNMPDVSPDGAKIVYIEHSAQDAVYGIFTIKLSGAEKELLFQSEKGISYFEPEFTSDGNYIIFVQKEDGKELGTLYGYEVKSGKKHLIADNITGKVYSK